MCVRRWLGGLAESTREDRLPLLERFFKSVGVSPSEAVAFQKKKAGSYRFVDKIYEFVEGKDLLISTQGTQASCIRGFFLACRAPLPKDRHRFHSNREPVVGELSVEEFRKILASCNLTYRAAYLMQFTSGSGVKEVEYINTHHANHIWDEIRKGRRIIRLNMPGRKANRNVRPYYTFIGSDAVEALKQLFHSRGWKRDIVLFRTEYGEPISTKSLQSYFKNHAFKLGIIKPYTPKCLECGGETVKVRHRIGGRNGPVKIYYLCTKCHREHASGNYNIKRNLWCSVRYRVRTHELRDLFRTEWHRAQRYFGVDPDVGRFCMGHDVDPLKYDKIMRDVPDTLAEYRKAMPMLNILSEDPRKVDRTEIDAKLEARDAEVEVLRREVAKFKKLERHLPLLLKMAREYERELEKE